MQKNDNCSIANKKNTNITTKKKASKRKHHDLYLCGACGVQLPDVPKSFDEESIGCDQCPLWFHFKCVNITKKSKPTSK